MFLKFAALLLIAQSVIGETNIAYYLKIILIAFVIFKQDAISPNMLDVLGQMGIWSLHPMMGNYHLWKPAVNVGRLKAIL